MAHCGSKELHDEWNCDDDSPVIAKTKTPKNIVLKLWDLCGKGYLGDKYKTKIRTAQFCFDCISKVRTLHPELNENPRKRKFDSHDDIDTSSELTDFRNVIDLAIFVNNLSENEKVELAYQLGRSQHALIKAKKNKVELENLVDIQIDSYLDRNNSVIVGFLKGISGTKKKENVKPDSVSNNYQLCKSVESVLNLASSQLLLPLHLRESILLYSITGSRLALTLSSAGSAYASYGSVRTFLSNLGVKSESWPENDTIVAFDNNQILQRRWKVQLQNKVQCNIVTIIASFEFDTCLQKNIPAPSVAINRNLSEDEIHALKYIDQDPKVKEDQYTHLTNYIDRLLPVIVADQQECPEENGVNNNIIADYVDRKVEEIRKEEIYKKCHNCGNDRVEKSHRLCRKCGKNIAQSRLNATSDVTAGEQRSKDVSKKYYRVIVDVEKNDSKRVSYEKCCASEYTHIGYDCVNSESNPKVHVHEPCNVNPCSYAAVEKVLVNIGQNAGVKLYNTGQKNWEVIVCDGVPYNLARRIIRTAKRCMVCDNHSIVYGTTGCQNHIKVAHPLEEQVTFINEFDWVVLIPGGGHIEMNMLKSFVELTWDVFWKDLAVILNFKSEAALKGAKKVSDHHKGWVMARIAREAIVSELLIPYVRQKMQNGSTAEISADDFINFTMDGICNPNYAFMCDVTLELLDSIFLFRDGVRCGDSELMHSGKAKFAKVWCGRVHPLYRELEMSDTLQSMLLPCEINDFVCSCLSLNLSGIPFTSEPPDFRLEEVNKQIQKWLPNVPTLEDWKKACDNFDTLKQLRKVTFADAEIKEPKSGPKAVQDISAEVLALRVQFRKSEYLSSPHEAKPHISLDGKIPLDDDLVNFSSISRALRARFCDEFIASRSIDFEQKPTAIHFSSKPVYISVQEREENTSIEALTKVELSNLIRGDIDTIQDDVDKQVYETRFVTEILKKKGKKPDKRAYINFYCEIHTYVEQQDQPAETQTQHDEDYED